jgi:hypothetical protein
MQYSYPVWHDLVSEAYLNFTANTVLPFVMEHSKRRPRIRRSSTVGLYSQAIWLECRPE